MTTNQERAAKVIAFAGAVCGLCERFPDDPLSDCPDCERCINGYVEELADAGLLMPDLPEPEEIDRYYGSKCWQLAPYVYKTRYPHVAIRIDHHGHIKINLSGEVESSRQLREIAHAALAAAECADAIRTKEKS